MPAKRRWEIKDELDLEVLLHQRLEGQRGGKLRVALDGGKEKSPVLTIRNKDMIGPAIIQIRRWIEQSEGPLNLVIEAI